MKRTNLKILSALIITVLAISACAIFLDNADESEAISYDSNGSAGPQGTVNLVPGDSFNYWFHGNGFTQTIYLISFTGPSWLTAYDTNISDEGTIYGVAPSTLGTFNCSAVINVHGGGGAPSPTNETINWTIRINSTAQYTIIYDTSHTKGTPWPSTVQVNVGSSITLPSTAPITNYVGTTFLGWFQVPNNGIREGLPGASYTPDRSRTLYACYTVDAPITYHNNGGAGNSAAETRLGDFYLNSSQYTYYTVSNYTPTRDNHTFLGWTTTPKTPGSTTTPEYVAGNQFRLPDASGITFYALWAESPSPRSISFNANGGTGEIPTQNVMTGVSITLPVSGFTRSGQYLSGWIDDGVSPSVRYNLGASYTTPPRNVTLKAEWTSYPSGFDNAAPSTGTVNVLYKYQPDLNNSWPLYKEVLWGGSYSLNVVQKPSWMNIDSTQFPVLTFSGIPNAPGVVVVEVRLAGPSQSIVNQSLHSWIITVSPAGGSQPQLFTVSYNNNGGSGSIPSENAVPYNNVIKLASEGFTRPGFTHVGWLTQINGTDVVYFLGSSYTVSGDVTMRAYWVAQSNIVILNANGGVGNIEPFIVPTDGLVTLPDSGFTRPGYTLRGWYLGSDPSTIYAMGYIYTVTSNTTFYAYWVLNGATLNTVTYNANGGTGGFNQQVESGKKVILPIQGFNLIDKTLVGWSLGSIRDEPTHQKGATYTVTGNTTFYCVWGDSYGFVTIVFDLAGGTGQIPIQTITHGSKAVKPTDPVRPGHIFKGWTNSISDPSHGLNAGPFEDWNLALYTSITLVAQWELHFSIAYDGTKITVTINGPYIGSSEINWGDGNNQSTYGVTATHDYRGSSSGIITVRSTVSGVDHTSSMPFTIGSNPNPNPDPDPDPDPDPEPNPNSGKKISWLLVILLIIVLIVGCIITLYICWPTVFVWIFIWAIIFWIVIF